MTRIVVAAFVIAIASSAGAEAGTLRAGPLVAKRHRCCVLNLDTKAVEVAIRLFDQEGTDVTGDGDLCAINPPLEPKQTCCAQVSQDVPFAAHCVIRATGRKRWLRGTLAAEQDPAEASAVLEAR